MMMMMIGVMWLIILCRVDAHSDAGRTAERSSRFVQLKLMDGRTGEGVLQPSVLCISVSEWVQACTRLVTNRVTTALGEADTPKMPTGIWQSGYVTSLAKCRLKYAGSSITRNIVFFCSGRMLSDH